MSRDALYQLEDTYHLIRKRKSLVEQYKAVEKKKPLKFFRIIQLVIGVTTAVIIGIIAVLPTIVYVLNLLVDGSSKIELLWVWGASLFIAIPYLLLTFVVKPLLQKSDHYKHNHATYLNEKDTILDQYKYVNSQLKQSPVPSKYLNHKIVHLLQEYLRFGRANTIGEAINIFEAEARHNQRIRQLKKVQEAVIVSNMLDRK